MLIVEDDVSSRKALRFLLVKRGYEVMEAGDVGTGRALLLANMPDILLLDLMLPDGSGTALLRRIRDGNIAMRIAVVTGASDRDLLDEVRSFHPDTVFLKPLQIRELTDWLGE